MTMVSIDEDFREISNLAALKRTRNGKILSIVIPMHNEQDVLEYLFERLERALQDIGVSIEIICVDDGSSDLTYQELLPYSASDPRIHIISLTRNFGKEAALTAGLDASTGHFVVPIDADLQDPPELISEFLLLWEQGYDVIYGVRADRSTDTFLKRLSANGFYRIFNILSPQKIPPSTGDFRLMDRAVVDALKRLPERNRFMKGLFTWVGFRQVGIPYNRPMRVAGSTSWNYWGLFRFAIDGITAFTTAPLRLWTFIGLASALIAVLYGIFLLVRVLVVGLDVPGYASIMEAILLGFAVQMIALGVIGEYIGRIYEEVKGRPIYMIRDRVGFKG